MAKKSKTKSALHDDLAAAEAELTEARAEWERANGRFHDADRKRAAGYSVSGEIRAPMLEAKARLARAEHARAVAAAALGAALQAEEVEAGDELALLSDETRTLADVQVEIAAAAEHDEQARAARRRASERIRAAHAARAMQAEQRRAAGLVEPLRFPRASGTIAGQSGLQAEVAAIEERVREGYAVPPLGHNVVQIEREAEDIRVARELERREREEEAQRRAAYQAQEDEGRRRMSERNREENAKRQAEHEAERAKRRELAEADRRRERGEDAAP